jgi:uncharacterized protein (TIGR00251 family)
VSFFIHVSPRARKARVGGLHGDALRVAVTAPPVEGEANRACVEALARALGLPRDAVRIASGQRGRRKRVVAEGDPGRLARRLQELGGPGAPGANARRE